MKFIISKGDRLLYKTIKPIAIVWLFSPLLIIITTQVKLPAEGLIGVLGAVVGVAIGVNTKNAGGSDKNNGGENE